MAKFSRFCKKQVYNTEINGEPVEFYSSSIRMLDRIHHFAGPILSALSAFVDSSNDRGLERRQVYTMDESENYGTSEIIYHPIDAKLATFRSGEKQQALLRLVSLLDQQSLRFLAEIILDSLREDKEVTPDEFLAEADIPALCECLLAVWEANTAKFGPLAAGVLRKIKDFLKARNNGTLDEDLTESSSSEPAEAEKTKPDPNQPGASKTSSTGSATPLSTSGESPEPIQIGSQTSTSLDSQRPTSL